MSKISPLPSKSVYYCGGLTLDDWQTSTQMLSNSPSSTRGKKKIEEFVGQDKTGRLLTSYYHVQNRGNLGKINLI